ncbi:hypothetical protein C7U89_05010 [Bradyrhizobium sp. WBOS4]|nr:hypothetical protein [Bradyrhizobium sp. WBOS4]
MSLTSYRAAPPRVKHLHAFGKCRDGRLRPALLAWLFQSVPKASLEGNPGAVPIGCGAYVSRRAGFGKGCGHVFFDFMTGESTDFRCFP